MNATIEPVSTGSNATELISGWVAGPQNRGTYNIIFSSILTLFLCTYTVQHFNTPGPGKIRTRSARVGMIIMGLLSPEWVSWVALEQLFRAHRFRTQMRAKGFATWTLEQSFYVAMGGLQGYASDSRRGQKMVILPDGMLVLVENGVVDPKADFLSTHQIRDKSKVDSIGRLLTLFQAVWMLVQVIGRLATHLPLTLLEVTTCAYLACGLVTYAAWWAKPKDIEVAVEIEIPNGIVKIEQFRDDGDILRLWDDTEASMQGSTYNTKWAIVGVSIIFSAIHAAAWQYSFPTEMEEELWRGFTIASAAIPILYCVASSDFVAKKISKPFDDATERNGGMLEPCSGLYNLFLLGLLCMCGWLCTRVVLIILAFISIRRVPENVYIEVQWSSLIPHI